MLLCFGGVCVPYTAVIPVILLGLRWFAAKLASWGLLPKGIENALNLPKTTNEQSPPLISSKSCCPAGDANVVKALESEDELENLLQSMDMVVCKFTASWCKPCHKIQPFYETCAAHFSSSGSDNQLAFLTVDVDEYDGIASKYKVAMMPTFVILKKQQTVATYSGSNEPELQQFLQEHLPSRS